MRYDRKIKYFDYKKDGERMHSAGFLKISVRDNVCDFQIQISGLHVTDTFCKEIYLVGPEAEEEISRIELQSGRGMVQLQLPANNLCKGIAYDELLAVRIPIGAGRELYCQVANAGSNEVSKADGQWKHGDLAEKVTSTTDKVEEKEIVLKEEVELAQVITAEVEPAKVKTAEVKSMEEESVEAEAVRVEPVRVEPVKVELAKVEPMEEPQPMLESKWSQIAAIYPHINPFQDEREYLKIGPEDFVIFNQRFYQLVHNSFLLHGYYNYQHLILARIERRGEIRYYIGVPGNFYEREKQVALMFGFESFECKEEPADNGDYGYYMIRVEL